MWPALIAAGQGDASMAAPRARATARSAAWRALCPAGAALGVALLSACAGPTDQPPAWDGRRGYDGNGDYGYQLNAPRAEASRYRMGAARSYGVPGPPEDPWGPHIRTASARFGVPEAWIREVMRQESGGRLYDAQGLPITSWAGAMGLMQVMPGTYATLRARHGLGPDPYEPRDNILAGAAYLREMHDRFGAPGFLAAYNAGPTRIEEVLAGITVLPDETLNYIARIAPRLGMQASLQGPFAVPGGGFYRSVAAEPSDLAFAGGGMRGTEYFGGSPAVAAADDPTLRAFDGGGLVTPDAPTGILTPRRR